MSITINLVFEDEISEFTMIKILDSFGDKYYCGISYPGNGFGYIKSNINGFNQAAAATPFFILTDLDNYSCPPELISDWLKHPPKPNFIFRIAIREIEAWLLADREGYSKFTGVSLANFPRNPELEINPKQTLINITRRSRKRSVREDIVPINENAQIGPNYNEQLMNYVASNWDIERAMNNSESLKRAYRYLEKYEYIAPEKDEED
jgi:hypothetical protein